MSSHILVVDDDIGLRFLLSKFLRESGYIISEAGSVRQMESIMELFQFDLIILDVMMPKESGIEFL